MPRDETELRQSRLTSQPRVRRLESRAAYLFAAPAFLFYLGFALVPLLATLVFSLSEIDRFTWDISFVGLGNYIEVWTDPLFWASFAHTFQFISMSVIGNVGLGLFVAVLLDRKMPTALTYFLRFAYFMPVLVATALVSLIWQFIYSTDLGILNWYLRRLGLPAVGWLTDGRVAMVSVVIMDVWKHFGFFMIILLAALQAVPRAQLEAGALDGAGPWQLFLHVKLPTVTPVLMFCITYATIGGLQVFDSVRILTNGGPGSVTMVMVLYMYEQTFGAQDLGTGSAAAAMLLVAIALVTAVQFRLGQHWVQR
jgi:multiple sugar transport system permease protein